MQIAQELEGAHEVNVKGILLVDTVYPRVPLKPVFPFSPPDRPKEDRTKNQILSQQNMIEARKMVATWDPPRFGSKRLPMIMLRANRYVPTDSPGISFVDGYREERTLGWDQHDKNMFAQVIDMDGHHFDIFDDERIQATTKVIRRALDALEALSRR